MSKSIVAICLFIALAPAALFAQPLADRVPADSFAYFGWKGSATSGNGYEGSHLQQVFAAAKYDAMIDQMLPQLAEKYGKDAPELFDNIDKAREILRPFWQHPTAIYVAATGDDNGPVRVVVVCQAGADAKSLAQRVRDAIAQSKDEQAAKNIVVSESSDVVTIRLGDDEASKKLPDIGTSTLRSDASFAASVKQTAMTDPFVVLHINVDAILKAVNAAAAKDEPDNAKKLASVIDASGMNGLHRITVAGAFNGKDWATARFVEAPSPRKGLVAAFDSKPIATDVFKMIPSSAASAQVFQFDGAAFVKELRNLFAAAEPEKGPQMFDQGIGAAQMMLGCNPMTDILEPLGETWLLYSDASVAGNGQDGIVIVNKLDDPARAKRGLNALWLAATNIVNGRMQGGPVSLTSTMNGDLRVSSLNVAGQYSPSWTIKDDKLIIAFTAENTVKAANAPTPASGFEQNTKFAELSKRLSNGAPITGMRYGDLPVTAPIVYDNFNTAYGMIRQLAGQQGVDLPESILPPKDVLMANLAPTAEVSWSDAAGMHARSISPFPGAETFSNAPNGSMTQLGAAGVGAGILLPSLNRARETANRVKCAANMRQIGQAILLHSNDNKGQYPADLGTLLDQDISPDVFICPSGKNAPPKGFAKMDKAKQAEWINANADYVYVGKGMNNAVGGDVIVLYEKEGNHNRDGMNMLYGDGHVAFVRMAQARKDIAELNKTNKP